MKNYYNLILSKLSSKIYFKKNQILLSLFILVLPYSLFADSYSANWFSASLGECDNVVSMNIGLYFDDGGTTNDDLWQSNSWLEMNNGDGWIQIAQVGGGCAGFCWNPNDDGGVYLNPNNARAISLRSPNNSGENTSGDEVFYAYIEIKLIQADVGRSIQFRVNGIWEDGGNSGTETVNFTRTPDLTSITAQDAVSCAGTEITWSLPAGTCSGTEANIYRNSSLLTTVPASNGSYIDATGTAGTIYQYSVELNQVFPGFYYPGTPDLVIPLLGNNFIIPGIPAVSYPGIDNTGGPSTENDGSKKDVPDFPSNFVASQTNCDGTVNLTWEWGSSNPNNFEIFRNGAVSLTTVGGNIRTYTDNVTRGVDYSYTIKAINECGSGDLSPPVLGSSPIDPGKVPDLNVSVVSGIEEANLSWTLATNTTGYQIERSLLGGGGSSFFDVDGTTFSFTDQSLVLCQTYEYRIRSLNDCRPGGVLSDTVATAKLLPDLSNTFDNASLLASKGYFPDRVELNWSLINNANSINQFKLFRKIAGTTNDSILIQSPNSGNNIHNDFLADAGVLYKYTIIAEMQCEATTLYSNAVSSIGFRSPIGTIAGQVSYSGGVAVEHVKISAETSTSAQGNSLLFDGTQSLQVQNNSNMDLTAGLSLELWINPSSHATNFSLVEKANSYSLKHVNSTYEFEVFTSPTNSQVVTIPDSDILLNNYTQLSAVLFNDSLRLYVNGLSTNYTLLTGPVFNNTNQLNIGIDYTGNIDELRLWNIGKSEDIVSRDFDRQMFGGEAGLVVYLKMNEGTGEYAYDFSTTGATNFNKNHALKINAPTWSTIVPTSSQLSLASYTNAQGNYILVVPYVGVGQTFTISPSYLIHEFNPSTRSLFIGEGLAIHNNVDFEDISSFTVEGYVFYDNTSCVVTGASLKIDGDLVISDLTNLPVLTDAQGHFEIQVPIGHHYITVEKNGHTFSVGRSPATGTVDFQDDVAGIVFQDNTLIKITGRIVGGLREAQYIPGHGKSTNNIGTAEIILTSTLGGGCFTNTITTDPVSGEYTTYAPPLKYNPTVEIIGNPIIDFGILDQIDISDAPSMQTEYDTLGFDTIAMVYLIDSFSFQKKLDYIYRVDPRIVVKDFEDPSLDFIGLKEYEFTMPNGIDTTKDLVTDPMLWPVFDARGDASEEEIKCYILVYEEYQNINNGKLDSVPTGDGDLVFNNQLTIGSTHSVDLKDVNSLDSLKFLTYGFKPAKPNFIENTSIPEYSFTETLEINYIKPNGTAIPWLPFNFNGTQSTTFATVYDGIYRAYILGAKADGQQFITEGPQIPEYILRDPPGSNSSASREVGTTKTTENSWKWSLGGSVGASDQIYLGAKFSTGLGVSIETEVENNLTLGFSASSSGGNAGKESVTITNTQAWGTNSSTDLPGKGSDLYIGKSKNVQFGISETLRMVPYSICGNVECIGDTFGGYSFAKAYGLSVIPKGYATEFIYNENHIKNYLITDLKDLRKAFFQPGGKYVTNLAPSHPNFALNNDDPRIDPSLPLLNSEDQIMYMLELPDSSYNFDFPISLGLPSETHWTSSVSQKLVWDQLDLMKNPDFDVLDGTSYTYNAINRADSLNGDSVRWVNNQILQWEQAIMLNEWEKVNINDASIRDRLKEKQLTDLYQKYKTAIIAYDALIAISATATAVTAVSTLIPGAGAVGAVTFAVGTGTGIAAAEVQEEVFRYENQKQIIKDKYDQTSTNYSISGGNTFTSNMSHQSSSSYTRTVEYGMSAAMELEVKGKVNNNGVGFKKNVSLDFSSGRDWGTSNSSTETVSFTLNEPDQGDYFSVDVFPSLLGWGPVFKLLPGGRTSCPFEDALVTEYYQEDPLNLNSANVNSPFYELSAKTFQRDKPTMSVAPSLLTNIPTTDAAVFNLTINNESESGDTRMYTVGVLSSSNPFGAIVRIDGQASISVSIPGGTGINKVLSVSKGPGPTYNYDSIMVLVYAPCQYAAGTSHNGDIVDTVYISAHFLPTCTDVNFTTPDDQWVLNNSFGDTMPIAIIDYNINFFDFNSIRLDYKPSAQASWIGLQTFFKDTTGMNDTTAIEIPTTSAFVLWDWMTDQNVDGDYDLRLTTECTLVDKTSLTHSGVMDRINPHPFGTPSPADGILDPNDDIQIRFNEPIDLGSLTSLNFDLRGVINGSETNHVSNLYFDGINDDVEITAGVPVQNRDFTLEFSVKRAGLGQEVILSQGSDANEQIYVGFNAANQLEFKINNQTINSNIAYTDNDWHYFSVSYSHDNETAEMFEASGVTTAAIINNGNTNIYPKYAGSDKMYIGKSAENNSYFNGNIDDVRIWNVTRTLAEFSIWKTKLLSSNQPGLLYNWRFDEANGLFAEDHVRSRNGIVNGAEWTVEPSGNAVSFDGVDDYLRIGKGDVNITEGMDFTLEFWFNSTQNDSATLVSNGTGTGLAADSLYSWNIAKDDAGKIHVYHDGNDFVAVDSNYFDGEWHHFALVLNRIGNMSAYLDGNLQNSVQAIPYSEFGGSAMYLGARGFYTGVVESFDSYFQGQMDEFRFWDASRKYEQITRDKHNRLQGDEFALRLYMPFENYVIDPSGIPILTPSLLEQIDTLAHIVLNPNGTSLISTTPKIKLPRPVESIAFTYSVNNDEIIITPTTSSELIENITIDITVKGIKDLHGNYMESPKTWIAYIDKNQVVWQDDALTFTKSFGDTLNFSSAVVNTGGATKSFTIENIPNWLTVSPTSGVITPNSTLPVNFEIDPLMNIGDYLHDVQLLTDFGYPEQLAINLKVREEEPSWSVDPADYINSMSIIGYLKIKDVVSSSSEDILSVFVDGNCRGVAHLQYIPLLDRHLVFLDVYSNLNNGETLTFKIWDASSGTIFTDVMPGNLSFVTNDVIGTINAPQLFETNFEISVDVTLDAGWNWVSNFLYNVDSTNLDVTLESLESVTPDEVKGQALYSNYLDGTGWVGALNDYGIRPEDGLKLKVSDMDTLVLKGDIIDPTTRTIDLVPGWNWIGFISIRNQNLKDALGNLTPADGDLIKAKTQFAVYNNLLGWVGSLQTMIPGSGYMYQSADSTSFVYPAVGQYKFGIVNSENFYLNKQWVVNHEKFASNMTSIVSLETDCDYILENENIAIGVFDKSDNCRAVNKMNLLDENKVGFLTIAGDLSENLRFSILDENTGRTFELDENVSFQANSHKGELDNALKLQISDEVCFKMQLVKAGEGDADIASEGSSELFQVYPTVFQDEVNLYYFNQNQELQADVVVYNVWGQIVFKQIFEQKIGFNKVAFDLNKTFLATGIYHFILNSGKESHAVKLIKK